MVRVSLMATVISGILPLTQPCATFHVAISSDHFDNHEAWRVVTTERRVLGRRGVTWTTAPVATNTADHVPIKDPLITTVTANNWVRVTSYLGITQLSPCIMQEPLNNGFFSQHFFQIGQDSIVACR